MKIDSMEVRAYPPIQELKVDGLSNLVSFAGPNGAGKTRLIQAMLQIFKQPNAASSNVRLILQATCPEETQLWGRDRLDTGNNDERQLLGRTLTRQQRRGSWRSSAIHFDSSRQFQKVATMPWSWSFTDPADDIIGWDFLFNPFNARYQDTVHALYRMLGHHRAGIAKKAIELQQAGAREMNLDFPDPLRKFKEAFSLLLDPKRLTDIDINNPQLSYSHNGATLDITSLSSGEKEVFSLVFDLLLRAPEDCVIFIDEPELHLHPELAFRLLKTLQTIGERNQFLLCTHSGDIISSSLEHSVVFVSRRDDGGNRGMLVSPTDDSVTALKELGQSLGVISLGRKIVLIEGSDRSLDRDLIGSIVQGAFPGLVLVPSGSRQSILAFDRIISEVLDRAVWGIDFFMLADRDNSLPLEELSRLEKGSNGRLRFLRRYHVENYFLDEPTIAEAFHDVVSENDWLRDPARIRQKLIELAKRCIPLAVNLWLGSQIRSLVGEVDVSLKGVVGMELEQFEHELGPRVELELKRVTQYLDPNKANGLAQDRWRELEKLLDAPGDDWKYDFPGKVLVGRLISEANIKKGHFQSLYLAAARRTEMKCFEEIAEILNSFETYSARATAFKREPGEL